MTTLPQTAPARLPRPAGAVPTLSNGANGHGPLAAHAAAAASTMSAADIWRVLRANLWLIFTFVVASALLGFAANRLLERYASRFTAKGYVSIQPPTAWNPITARSSESLTDFSTLAVEQKTQAMLIKNDSLFTRVLQDPGSAIRSTSWYHRFEIPVRQPDGTTRTVLDAAAAKRSLNDYFAATPVENSKLVSVEMTYSVPRDARDIVMAIISKHLEISLLLIADRQVERSGVLNTLKTRITNHIKELKETIHQKALELNIDSPNGAVTKYSVRDAELTSLTNQRLQIEATLRGTKTVYDSIMAQINQGVDPQEVDAAVAHDGEVSLAKRELDQYEMDLQIAITQAGQNSPLVRTAQKRVDVYRQKYEEIKTTARVEARTALINKLTSDKSNAQQQLDTINAQISKLNDELGELSIAMSDYFSLNDELKKAEEDQAQTKKDADALNIAIQQSISNVTWAQQPTIPDTPSFPKLAATMSVSIMLGLMFSVGIAFLREMMDTTVRSPRDIARVGSLNLLGMVPHEDDDPQSAGVPLPMVIYQAPTSIMAEGFRQVRTRLQHAASLDTTRSILVTSPSPGDGKTVVASNLAAGLALNGRKILLVDANFRRPALDKSFALDNSVGFSDVLVSLDRFDASVHKTQVPNLDVLTTGPRPANATELLESQLLLDFIERALEEYDHVIFDTGPMLLVSETAALAPRVDGVVTVVRARANSRGVLQRLRDSLRQLKAEHLGVVLNAVRSQGGGYYGRNIKTYYEYSNGHAAN